MIYGAALDACPPDDLPIWARLALTDKAVRFVDVDCWKPEDFEPNLIWIFTVFGGVTVVQRHPKEA